VHRAPAAGGFIRLEGAALNAPQGVGLQVGAFRAQNTFRLVLRPAENAYHARNCFLFLQDVFVVCGSVFWHRPIIPERKKWNSPVLMSGFPLSVIL